MAAREIRAGRLRALLWPAPDPRGWLLLHGFTGAPTAFSPLVDRLDGMGPFLAPWLPGHDGADWPADLFTFDAVVDTIAEAAHSVRDAPWHVIGYSMGGRLALRLALRHPDLTAGLTLLGARPGLKDEAERTARQRDDAARAALLRENGTAAFVARWEALPLFATQQRLPEALRARQRDIRLGHDAEALARALEILGTGAMPSCWPELPQLSVPVRLVVGGLDAAYIELAAEVAAVVPHATVSVVPGCGHNIVLEDPGTLAELISPRRSAREAP